MLTHNAGSESKMAPFKPSEEELGKTWDRCLVDTAFKSVGGVAFGTLVSFLLFKRKSWPITLGLGIGLGAGYSNCRHHILWQRCQHHGPFAGKGPSSWVRRPPWMRKDEKKPEETAEENRTDEKEPVPKPAES